MTSTESMVTLVKFGGISLNVTPRISSCLTLKTEGPPRNRKVDLIGERHEPHA